MYKVTKDELLLESLVEHTRKKRNDCKSLLKYKSVQVNGEVQTYHAFELHPGDEVEVTVTFPDDYGVDELNGKEAVFDVTVNGIYE